MNELALFAGAGGGILGGQLLGWRTVGAVELDPYCRRVLLARQRDGVLPRFAVWDNVCTFDGKPWRGHVDVVSGGFPCQDISSAGKGAGITGAKSGLWKEMARIIREVGPRFVFVENSPVLTSRGLGVVLGDLAEMGFDARWGVLGARHVGAPHRRDRIWIIADNTSNTQRPELRDESGRLSGSSRVSAPEPPDHGEQGDVADAEHHGQHEGKIVRGTSTGENEGGMRQSQGYGSGGACWWATEPDVGRVADGVASRVDRLRAIGNGQVPAVAALAWKILAEEW